ncbi:hypothetical protein Salat_2159800 [Sesamum alatum]|uniref:Uncharacterized protein n=1 Tax=Sesamum alatum TaxID=300844 RepID=A0AAE2CH85_9LAMI|nr:hypothetical protein Salat_2159800 [Sesamum alatum]
MVDTCGRVWSSGLWLDGGCLSRSTWCMIVVCAGRLAAYVGQTCADSCVQRLKCCEHGWMLRAQAACNVRPTECCARAQAGHARGSLAGRLAGARAGTQDVRTHPAVVSSSCVRRLPEAVADGSRFCGRQLALFTLTTDDHMEADWIT